MHLKNISIINYKNFASKTFDFDNRINCLVGNNGVGKTNVSVNIAMSLAATGQKVMILDADLGLANIDVLLGLHPRLNISHVLSGEYDLSEVIVDAPGGIKIIPAVTAQTMTTDVVLPKTVPHLLHTLC